MAKVKFYLEKRKNKEGELITSNVPILLFYSFNGQRLQYFTGERIDAKHYVSEYWKTGKDPIKRTAPGAEMINRNLNSLRIQVETIHSDTKALGIPPTVELFRNKLNDLHKGTSAQLSTDPLVIDALNSFIEDRLKFKSHNTYRNNTTFANHLKNFIGAKASKSLTFKDITQKFVNDFNEYLVSDLKQINNTAAKNARTLRTFLNYCQERRLYIPSELLKFQVRENEPAIIALKESEVLHLYNLKLTSAKLEKVRDAFVFMCMTSLRYSDVVKLKKHEIRGDFIQFNIRKGESTSDHTVPLLPIAKEILAKYQDTPEDTALPVPSNQKMNQYLKEVCELAGFDQVVTITELYSGQKRTKQFKKFELISCHTGRKSFISMAVNKRMSEAFIKSITGHTKNSKSFIRYYEIDGDEKRRALNEAFNIQ